MEKRCKTHCLTEFKPIGKGEHQRFRCAKCNVERVTKRRRKLKLEIIEHFGGKCCVCGYDKYPGALAFHHLDPTKKDFSIGAKGNTKSLENQLKEAEKCILVCHNCHSEIHAGVITIPQ